MPGMTNSRAAGPSLRCVERKVHHNDSSKARAETTLNLTRQKRLRKTLMNCRESSSCRTSLDTVQVLAPSDMAQFRRNGIFPAWTSIRDIEI
ncbi:hypothetical protein KIN20_020338 [Parelaphostrongylus tenuis]|uniref:Uncharacterized protein n=1 Tax=Parelaphostrongylus tenuis TaxID=148309 RepID=A0AAD5MR39_PARTN|nr:hypothetical protein KIN20_020338 [Parelaphostrongylus tenuis]